MYIKPIPLGVNPLKDEDRQPIMKIVSGDSMVVGTKLSIVIDNTEVPATPDNSTVEFKLAENQFADTLWTGTWNDGVEQTHGCLPGMVEVTVPRRIADDLRRGSYSFSIVVSTKTRMNPTTQLRGTILVEYAPTSPINEIPYRSNG